MLQVAVYCASSDDLPESFRADARALGEGLATRDMRLVYGGGNIGLMGEVARAAHQAGGRVSGYIPERLMAIEGRAFGIADELVVTSTMQERKRKIFERADAFIVLPGGMGTIEEFMEVLTLRKLGYHDKPILLVNTDGFWTGLTTFLSDTVRLGLSPALSPLFSVVSHSDEALTQLDRAVASASSGS